MNAEDISKKRITFQVESSSKRRNVDKHVVRSVLLHHSKLKKEILEEYKKYGLELKNYQIACESLETIKDLERNGKQPDGEPETIATHADGEKAGSHRTKRDYGKTINAMLKLLEMQLILKCCIQHSLEQIRAPDYKRVKSGNRKIYETTLQDYLTYIEDLLKAHH